MNIAIVGSRNFNIYDKNKHFYHPEMEKAPQAFHALQIKLTKEWVFKQLDHMRFYLAEDNSEITIISGGAEGPDSWAAEWADSGKYNLKVFYADWKTHGKAAGPIRNTQIVEAADRLIAFWDGKSRGTLDSITKAQNKGIVVEVHLQSPMPHYPKDLMDNIVTVTPIKDDK